MISNRQVGGTPPLTNPYPSRGLENRTQTVPMTFSTECLDIRHRPPAVGQRIMVSKQPTPAAEYGVSTPQAARTAYLPIGRNDAAR